MTATRRRPRLQKFSRADEGDCFELATATGGNRAYDPAVRKALPDHPFIFSRPVSEAPGGAGQSREYVQTPRKFAPPSSKLSLIWTTRSGFTGCPDDKYPIELVVIRLSILFGYRALSRHERPTLLRCKALLRRPEATLHPQPKINSFGDVYWSAKAWHQIGSINSSE